MSVIEVRRQHGMAHQQAVAAAGALADDLSRQFAVQYDWQGEDLHFHRNGAKGYLRVEEDLLHLRLELGFLLRPFKSRIEAEIHQQLDRLTGTHQV